MYRTVSFCYFAAFEYTRHFLLSASFKVRNAEVKMVQFSSTSAEISSHPRFLLNSGLKEHHHWSVACHNQRGHFVDLFLHRLQLKYSDQIWCDTTEKTFKHTFPEHAANAYVHTELAASGYGNEVIGENTEKAYGPAITSPAVSTLGQYRQLYCNRVSAIYWLKRLHN